MKKSKSQDCSGCSVLEVSWGQLLSSVQSPCCSWPPFQDNSTMQVVIMTQRFKEKHVHIWGWGNASKSFFLAQILNYTEEIHQTECCCLQGLKFIQFLVLVKKGDSPGGRSRAIRWAWNWGRFDLQHWSVFWVNALPLYLNQFDSPDGVWLSSFVFCVLSFKSKHSALQWHLTCQFDSPDEI